MLRRNVVKDLEDVLNHLEKEISALNFERGRLYAKKEIISAMHHKYSTEKKENKE